MREQGIDVISLSAGEPDFATPEHICAAAIEAIKSGFTKYTPTSGIRQLKEAIVGKLGRENGIKANPDQIVVSSGAKQSLYNAMMVLLEPGDEVLLFAPFWVTYEEQVRLAGGVPIIVQTESASGFVPDMDAIRNAITARTKAVVINSPCNPTGALYSRDTLKEIAALALRHDLWVISDEIYDRLVYGETHVSIASLGREIAERTITVGGCSKSYSMTGWRIGFSASAVPVAKACSNLQDQVSSNPTSFAQKGAVAAFTSDSSSVETMRAEFEARRDMILPLLRSIPSVTVNTPKGAFYVLPDVSAYLGGRFETDLALAEHLLESANVACVPGSVFAAPGTIRLSYAASREDIRRGVERIGEALQNLGR